MKHTDRDQAILWARERMKGDFVILDTETTGLGHDDEAVSIAVVDKSGQILLDTLLCHEKQSDPRALAVHGHTWEETRSAPRFPEIWPQLVEITQDKPLLIYNAQFDCRIIEQMMHRYLIEINAAPIFRRDAACAMEAFAAFYGEWSDYRQSYKWQSLSRAARYLGVTVVDAHNAAGDALMTLKVVEKMAAWPLSEETLEEMNNARRK